MTNDPVKPAAPDPAPARAGLLSIPEAASVLDVSERTVRRAIERGELDAVKVGRALHIPVAALTAWRRTPATMPVRERPRLRLVEYAREDDPGAGGGRVLAAGSTLVRVPRSLTGFVGRAHDLATVTGLLRRDDVRLLTLMGVGGVGKTRLAMRAADEVATSFADGVAFVPLASVRDSGLVLATIVEGLGLQPVASQPPLAQLGAALGGKRMLLVLDNVEHLAPAGPAVVELLAACDGLTILVTSRVRLRLSGERTYSVQPLAVPPSPRSPSPAERAPAIAELGQVESVQLFVERAQAARADFTLTAEQAPAVAAICARLEGLPLAIELAAARCAVLTPASMLSRLDQRLPLLTGGPRDQPDRLRTMRDAITWSYDLMSPAEQGLFRRLSVFTGGFTLGAVEAMLRSLTGVADDDPAAQAFATIEGLVGQSMVVATERADGAGPAEPRFTMLETIREFGREKLTASGEERAARAAHAAYLLSLAAAEPAPPPGDDRREAERDNLREALAWVIEQRDADAALRLAAVLCPVWRSRGPYGEGRAWLEQALALPGGAEPVRLTALLGLTGLHYLQGAFTRAAAVGEAALALARRHDDRGGIARSLGALGQAVERTGDLPRAIACYEEALAIFRAIGDATGEAETLGQLGIAAWEQDDIAAFTTLAEDALAIWRRLEHPAGIIESLDRLSLVARLDNRLRDQAALASEIVTLTGTVEDPVVVTSTLWTAASIAGERGQATLSARLFGAEQALREATGLARDPAFADSYTTMVRKIRSILGESRFGSIWAAGRTLAPAQALTEAKAAMDLLASPTTGPGDISAAAAYGLTPREREVLRLVVSGASDKEIAATLFVSRSTASKHVSAILEKLGAESRTAATALAYRDGLI